MHKIKIVAENFSDTGRITTSPALATDKENLKSQSIAKIARTDVSALGAQQDITIDLVPIQTVSAVVLGRHNFPLDMTLEIILKDIGGVPLYSSGTITITEDQVGERNVPWDAYLWDTPASNIQDVAEEFTPKANYVFWVEEEAVVSDNLQETTTGLDLLETTTGAILIETGGATNPGFVGIADVASVQILIDVPAGKQVEIGRLFIGDYISTVYNVTFNHTIEWKETAKQYRTISSTLRSDISIPVRKLAFSLELINDEDRTELQAGLRYVGLRKDFYIDLFPADTSPDKQRDYSGIMKLTGEPVMSEYANDFYRSKYVMEEV